MNFTIRSAARNDILRQYKYYLVEKDAEAAAERFIEAVQATLERICRQPEIGVPKTLGNRSLEGLRSWPVKGFSAVRIYYIFSRSQDVLRVIRILHGKRDLHPLLEDESADP